MEQAEDFSRYNGEGTQLRALQLRLVDMLVLVDGIAREHGIPYWVDAGTLLGAVRHGGFIPWDDDIDICVMREDFPRMREALLACLPERYTYSDWTTDENYFEMMGRVRDSRSFVRNRATKAQKYQGIFLDVCMVERTTPFLKRILEPVYSPFFYQVHNIGKAIYGSEVRRIGMKSFAWMVFPFLQALVMMVRWGCRMAQSDCVMNSYSQRLYYRRYLSDIFPLGEVEFEGHRFSAPKDVDAYLRKIYGDYMRIPDEAHRMFHISHVELYD